MITPTKSGIDTSLKKENKINTIRKLIAALLTTTVRTNTAMSGLEVKAMSGVEIKAMSGVEVKAMSGEKVRAMSKRPALSCNTVDNDYADLACVDLGSYLASYLASYLGSYLGAIQNE